MNIRAAASKDARAIAELTIIAGAGIPDYFWEQSLEAGQEPVDVGTARAASGTGNFSYRNAWVAPVGAMVAGMVLAYRLADEGGFPDPGEFPQFLRPLLELESCAPGSFYVNMLAVYPECRGRGIGSALMKAVDGLAVEAGCRVASVQVFDENEGAVRFYQRLGYRVVEERPVVPFPRLAYGGRVLLMVKDVEAPVAGDGPA
jgi:ribosomal protein S18 acetylase RimI-like enzyme